MIKLMIIILCKLKYERTFLPKNQNGQSKCRNLFILVLSESAKQMINIPLTFSQSSRSFTAVAAWRRLESSKAA